MLSFKEKSAFVWATLLWLAQWVRLLAIGIAWLAALGFAIYQFRFYRGSSLIGFLAGCALALFFLGVWFVSTVDKFYEWWKEQSLRSLLKEIETKTTTPSQRLDDLLKEYESRITLNFSESMKSQMASSPTFRATVAEATKLVLEAVVFQSSPYNEMEQKTFRRTWQAKVERFSERIAQEDPLAVEVILQAIEKESHTAGS